MKIKYFSDLHLEFLNLKPEWVEHIIKTDADILILAGDIGYPYKNSYSDFLIKINSKFKRIYLITGNHEYYSNYSMEQINIKIKEIIQDNSLENIKFLLNEYDDYEGYRFVGTTLWTHISNPNYLINDFNQILGMTVEKYNLLHKDSVDFLTKTLNDNHNTLPVIVVTHHLPSYELTDPKYESYAKYNQCFSSNLDYLIKRPIVGWFYGHTHSESFKEINGVKLCCNPIGYPRENVQPDFNRMIEL